MKHIKYLLMGISIFSIFSCKNVTTAYKGEYKNKKVVIKNIETKGFSTNSNTRKIQYGDVTPLLLDAATTDFNDRPYSADVFGDVPIHWFDTNHSAYRNTMDFEKGMVTLTMLYISPHKFSKDEFEAYADFFKNKWPEYVNMVNTKEKTYVQNYAGIVYGEHRSFVQFFKGEEDGKPFYFDIQPDGVIGYHSGEVKDFNASDYGNSLADKVEMPGKIIRIMDTAVFNIAKLRNYKDDKGKSMEDYFTIKTATDNTADIRAASEPPVEVRRLFPEANKQPYYYVPMGDDWVSLGERWSIRLLDVLSDNRCPLYVVCEETGKAAVKVQFKLHGKEDAGHGFETLEVFGLNRYLFPEGNLKENLFLPHTIRHTDAVTGQQIGFTITLLDLSPYPRKNFATSADLKKNRYTGLFMLDNIQTNKKQK